MSEAIREKVPAPRFEYRVTVYAKDSLDVIVYKDHENIEKAAFDFVIRKTDSDLEGDCDVSLETMVLIPFPDGTYQRCS